VQNEPYPLRLRGLTIQLMRPMPQSPGVNGFPRQNAVDVSPLERHSATRPAQMSRSFMPVSLTGAGRFYKTASSSGYSLEAQEVRAGGWDKCGHAGDGHRSVYFEAVDLCTEALFGRGVSLRGGACGAFVAALAGAGAG